LGTDPEREFRGDKGDRVVAGKNGAERPSRTPGVASPPEHLDTIICRKLPQAGTDATARKKVKV
jgi:hypothetical protein